MDHKHEAADYTDLLELPHPTSSRHPRMARCDRAAQFAPFSALTGYDDAIDETARLTDAQSILSEDRREELDRQQQLLLAHVDRHPIVAVTYFLPDARKAGGSYRIVKGVLSGVDEQERVLVLANGHRIPLDRICELDSELFHKMV